MMKSPEWEREIGIEWYITEFQGSGGRIREKPEDFIVEEEGFFGRAHVLLLFGKKAPKKVEGSGKYLHMVMEKKNWETTEVIRRIAKITEVPLRKITFAGTKDKRAVTAQWICIEGVTWNDFSVSLKDVAFHTPFYSNKKIRLGDLKGNWFTVRIRKGKNIKIPGKVPNYFGHQRFGVYRFVTHIVGKKVLEGDYEGAIMEYLCKTSPYEPEITRKAREKLRKEQDFKDALEYFPKELRHERRVLRMLSESEDFKKAFKTFHPKMQSMFLHAFQSYLFNKILSKRLELGELKETIVPGYRVVPDELEEEVLEGEGVDLQEFKKFKKYGTAGEKRAALADVKSREVSGDVVRFFLGKGSYATIVLREIMKPESPEGFLYCSRRGDGEDRLQSREELL